MTTLYDCRNSPISIPRALEDSEAFGYLEPKRQLLLQLAQLVLLLDLIHVLHFGPLTLFQEPFGSLSLSCFLSLRFTRCLEFLSPSFTRRLKFLNPSHEVQANGIEYDPRLFLFHVASNARQLVLREGLRDDMKSSRTISSSARLRVRWTSLSPGLEGGSRQDSSFSLVYSRKLTSHSLSSVSHESERSSSSGGSEKAPSSILRFSRNMAEENCNRVSRALCASAVPYGLKVEAPKG